MIGHRNAGRKATAATYAPRLVWDSSKQGTLRHSPPPQPLPRAVLRRAPVGNGVIAELAKPKAPARSLNATRWTTRTKRHGGLSGLLLRRLVDFKLIADHKPRNDSEREMLIGVLEWLKENPVRTLPQATKDYFG
jgi:hypothetical protein